MTPSSMTELWIPLRQRRTFVIDMKSKLLEPFTAIALIVVTFLCLWSVPWKDIGMGAINIFKQWGASVEDTKNEE